MRLKSSDCNQSVLKKVSSFSLRFEQKKDYIRSFNGKSVDQSRSCQNGQLIKHLAGKMAVLFQHEFLGDSKTH